MPSLSTPPLSRLDLDEETLAVSDDPRCQPEAYVSGHGGVFRVDRVEPKGARGFDVWLEDAHGVLHESGAWHHQHICRTPRQIVRSYHLERETKPFFSAR